MQPNTKLPKVGTTIFTVMSQLAAEHGAVNLGQGFPDFSAPQRLQRPPCGACLRRRCWLQAAAPAGRCLRHESGQVGGGAGVPEVYRIPSSSSQ